MPISIVFDTNTLFDKNASLFKCFSSRKNLSRLIDFIKEKKWLKKVKIFIPYVVINELIELKISEFTDFKKSITKIKTQTDGADNSKEFESFLTKLFEMTEEDYEKKIRSSYKEELKIDAEIEINELEIPNKNCFDDILERAFNKKIPFNPEHGSSDKGFKDTLILESILQNKKMKNSIVILYSNDKGFDGIEEEFNIENKENKFCLIKLAKTKEEVKKDNKYKTIEMVLEEVMNVK